MQLINKYVTPSTDTMRKGIYSNGIQHVYFKHSPVSVDLPDGKNITEYMPEVVKLHSELVASWESICNSILSGIVNFNFYGTPEVLSIVKYSYDRAGMLSSITLNSKYSKYVVKLKDTDFNFNMFDKLGKTLYNQDVNNWNGIQSNGIKASGTLMRCTIAK